MTFLKGRLSTANPTYSTFTARLKKDVTQGQSAGCFCSSASHFVCTVKSFFFFFKDTVLQHAQPPRNTSQLPQNRNQGNQRRENYNHFMSEKENWRKGSGEDESGALLTVGDSRTHPTLPASVEQSNKVRIVLSETLKHHHTHTHRHTPECMKLLTCSTTSSQHSPMACLKFAAATSQ